MVNFQQVFKYLNLHFLKFVFLNFRLYQISQRAEAEFHFKDLQVFLNKKTVKFSEENNSKKKVISSPIIKVIDFGFVYVLLKVDIFKIRHLETHLFLQK